MKRPRSEGGAASCSLEGKPPWEERVASQEARGRSRGRRRCRHSLRRLPAHKHTLLVRGHQKHGCPLTLITAVGIVAYTPTRLRMRGCRGRGWIVPLMWWRARGVSGWGGRALLHTPDALASVISSPSLRRSRHCSCPWPGPHTRPTGLHKSNRPSWSEPRPCAVVALKASLGSGRPGAEGAGDIAVRLRRRPAQPVSSREPKTWYSLTLVIWSQATPS